MDTSNSKVQSTQNDVMKKLRTNKESAFTPQCLSSAERVVLFTFAPPDLAGAAVLNQISKKQQRELEKAWLRTAESSSYPEQLEGGEWEDELGRNGKQV
ncbi:hypothetical protein STEG23_004708 [Scotinomys teguina]